MYAAVQVPKRNLVDQRVYVGEEVIRRLQVLAQPLRGVRVLNLTVSPFGTGVAEMLSAVVPLLQDLGIESEWQFVAGDAELNQAARTVYDGLSGRGVNWGPQPIWKWLLYNRLNAHHFDGSYDIVVVHEPQPTALPLALAEMGRDLSGSRWIWHCHLDLRCAQDDVWATLQPILRHYDACVFSHQAFAPPEVEAGRIAILPPAIDPSGARNTELSRSSVHRLLDAQGIDAKRPLVVQVAPLAESFGPTKAIDAVRRARAKYPDLQLLLIQPTVEPSVEAWSRFEEVARYAAGDPAVRVMAVQGDTGSQIINAAQRAADIVIQTSVPAGFSHPLWEAMWKGRPVLTGRSGGLPLQVEDGTTGLVAGDESSLAQALLSLLEDRGFAARLGANAQQQVRHQHLLPRFLEDELRLYSSLLPGAPTTASKEAMVDA